MHGEPQIQMGSLRCGWRTPYVNGELQMWMGNPSCRWETPDPDGDPWTQSPRWGTPDVDEKPHMQMENPRRGWGNLDANGEPRVWMVNPGCRWGAPNADGEPHMGLESPRYGQRPPYVDMGSPSSRHTAAAVPGRSGQGCSALLSLFRRGELAIGRRKGCGGHRARGALPHPRPARG